ALEEGRVVVDVLGSVVGGHNRIVLAILPTCGRGAVGRIRAVATQPGRIVLTYEDLLDTPDDGKRYEILEGDLYLTAAPNLAHQHCVGMLLQIIGPHVRGRGLGRIYIAPTDVLLSNISVVEPDLVFVSRERLDVLTPANVRGTPDLAIEVLSPSTERT